MESLNDFHFLRPLWFLVILPLLWLCYHLWKKRLDNTGLESIIDKKLLSHLVEGQNKRYSSSPIIGLLFIWIVTITALAGPTWKKIPQALVAPESAVVILLDLSPSMRAKDLKPSRIIRAHLKIQDLLSQRKEGLTALVVYAGEAHIVTPLTDDVKTISNLLPTLQPGILPLPGSNTEMGITVSVDLVNAANLPKASILLITDNIDQSAFSEIQKQLPKSISLTILGLGTDEGAPIPNNGDFIKDKNGNIIIAKRNSQLMQDLAERVDGYYLPIQSSTADIDFYYQQLETLFNANLDKTKDDRKYDAWYEFGPILLLLMTPFVLLAFRRGLVISLCSTSIVLSSFSPSPAQASAWDYLWKNDDQRAIEQYQGENYSDAAKTFNNPQWKGHAHYKNGDYEAALQEYSKDKSAISDYNKGNALAQLQRYDDAIAAYDQALKKNPQLEPAKTNKKIIEDLKAKQEKNTDNNDS
ncbi:MAG: VWA domain-containing protein, partial [Cellvibrionaceae bacterium]